MRRSSRVKIRANRMNGPLSHGPITEEGKRRAAESNLRHGVYSTRDLLPAESRDEFELVVQQYVAKLRPRTSSELDQVREVALAYWRTRRLKLIREQTLSPGTPELQALIDWQHSGLVDPTSLDPVSAAAIRKIGILGFHNFELQGHYMRSLHRFHITRRGP